MRLICTISADQHDENPLAFSYFLTSLGIANNCEEVFLPDQKKVAYRIWVYEEDDLTRALALFAEYEKNPHDPRFHISFKNAPLSPAQKNAEEEEKREALEQKRGKHTPWLLPYGPWTIGVLVLVIALFIFSQFQRESSISPPKIQGIAEAPLLSPLERNLLFDYPKYFALRDELFKIYSPKAIKEGESPPPEANVLIAEMKRTPFWQGFYDRIVTHYKDPATPLIGNAPLFEKIAQGEVWRFVTPAFLHLDILHIFFNVLWFIILSNQIERRIKGFRYVLLFLAGCIIPNTAQYLMSGAFFMGLSGVVCAMAGFIFARQQMAPWEGYLLQRLTLIFLVVFVFGLFALQVVFFFLQLFSSLHLSVPIANTAHIVGGLVGYLVGRLRYFSLHRP